MNSRSALLNEAEEAVYVIQLEIIGFQLELMDADVVHKMIKALKEVRNNIHRYTTAEEVHAAYIESLQEKSNF